MDNNVIAEPLFQSIDTIVSSRIEGISFDTTILCTVVDVSKASQGRYVVTNNGGITKFEAVSEKTDYKKNDNVYVQIPKGDWNEQKYILYKKTTKEDEPYVYQSPLNSIIQGPKWESANSEWGIMANLVEENEKTAFTTKVSTYQKYSRLGIAANFKTDFGKFYDNEYNGPYIVTEGNYGIKLFVTFEDNTSAVFALDCTDMNGNPYDFNGYYQQEKVFDISKFQNKIIKNLKITFFEENNFADSQGHKYPCEKGKVLNNIFVKDIQIIFGYDKKKFSTDAIIFTTATGETSYQGITPYKYQPNEYPMTIGGYFRWIHQLDSGDFVINPDDEDFDIYIQRREGYRAKASFIEDPALSDGWVTYGVGHYKSEKQTNSWLFYFDNSKHWQSYHVPGEEFYINEIPFSYVHKDEISETPVYYFSKTETYRLFIIKKNGEKYQSKDLVLTNVAEGAIEYEDYLAQKKQENQQNQLYKQLNAVQATAEYQIRCEDNSFGVYSFYGQDGKIINQNIKRNFQIYSQKIDNIWEKMDDNCVTYWTIPKNSLIIKEGDNPNLVDSTVLSSGFVEYVINGSNLKYELPIILKQESVLIQCRIVKDGVEKTASSTIYFNKQGTGESSFSFTLVLSSAPVISSDTITVEIIPKIFDANGAEVNLSNKQSFTWQINEDATWTENTQGNVPLTITRYLPTELSTYCLIVTASTEWAEEVNEGFENTILTASLPIPLRYPLDGKVPMYFSGPTEVIYDLNGVTANFANIPYQLYDENNQPIENLSWKIGAGQDSVFAPFIKKDKNNNFYLKPKEAYIKADSEQVSVIAYDENENMVWIQPIYITQNKYPIGTINDCNKKTALIGNAEGLMSSLKGVAGSKDTTKRFNGMAIGDWLENNSGMKNFGLYGFKNNIMQYAFRDNGTGFIGSSNCGTIKLDENGIIIQSDNYDGVINSSTGEIASIATKGLNIDLKKGVINTPQFRINSNGEIELGTKGGRYSYIDDNGLKTNQITFYDQKINTQNQNIGYIQQNDNLFDEEGNSVSGIIVIAQDTAKKEKSRIELGQDHVITKVSSNSNTKLTKDKYQISFLEESQKAYQFTKNGLEFLNKDSTKTSTISGDTNRFYIALPGVGRYCFTEAGVFVEDETGTVLDWIWRKVDE